MIVRHVRVQWSWFVLTGQRVVFQLDYITESRIERTLGEVLNNLFVLTFKSRMTDFSIAAALHFIRVAIDWNLMWYIKKSSELTANSPSSSYSLSTVSISFKSLLNDYKNKFYGKLKNNSLFLCKPYMGNRLTEIL